LRTSITTDLFNYSYKLALDEKLGLFKKFGFDYIHWCDNWNDDKIYSKDQMKEYSDLITDHGLTCLDVHGTATPKLAIDSLEMTGHRGFIKLLENRIQFCHMVGGDSVVVHPPKVYKANYEKRVHMSKKALLAVQGLCIDLDVTLAIENCHRGDHVILRDYFSLYDPEFIGFCFDSGHSNLNNNLDYLMRFSDRLRVTHLHDNQGLQDDHQYPGWGTIDWVKVSGWLRDSGYGKPWNLEVAYEPRINDESVEEYMQKIKDSTVLF